MSDVMTSLVDIFNYTITNTPKSELDRDIFKDNVLTALLMSKGRIFRMPVGTMPFGRPFVADKPDTISSYEGLEQLDFKFKNYLDNLEFKLKKIYGTMAFTHEEIENLKKKGRRELELSINDKKDLLFQAIAEEIDTMIYGDGTGNSGKDFGGLKEAISTTPSTGSYGGKTRSSFSSLQNQYDTEADFANNGLATMTTMYNNCSKSQGVNSPDIILTSQTQWERFNALLDPKERVVDLESAKLGYQSITFMGVPVVWTADVDDTYMYFLNSKYIEFIQDDVVWLQAQGKDIPGVMAEGMVVVNWGNLIFRRLDYSGLLVISG